MANLTQVQRDKLEASDFGDPSRRLFPITDQDDVDSAAHLIGKAQDPEAVKRRIIAIAKRKGLKIPEAWMSNTADKSADEREAFEVALGAVKAMGEGRIRVSLVPFTTPDDPDSDGEYFDTATDFDRDFPAKMSLWWHHCMDDEIGDRRLGRVEVKASSADLWFEHQLDLSDEYEAKMYRLAEMGRLGGSSGAASHLVRKSRVGKSVHIDRWPLAEASILVTPSHPCTRGRTIALKSWEPVAIDQALEEGRPWSTSLAENTDRWMDDGMYVLSGYTSIAAKAGRKLSQARRERLMQMRQMIDDLLSETVPQDAAAAEASAPPPGMGEGAEVETLGKGIALPITSSLDLNDLYAAAMRQYDAAAFAPTGG